MIEGAKQDLRAARAGFAFRTVRDWNPRWFNDANAKVQGLPIQIRMQGLMVALAMLIGENKDHSRNLAGTLARWLLERAPYRPFGQGGGEATAVTLLERCAEADRGSYAAAQREAVLLVDQIKIFAKAWAERDKSQGA